MGNFLLVLGLEKMAQHVEQRVGLSSASGSDYPRVPDVILDGQIELVARFHLSFAYTESPTSYNEGKTACAIFLSARPLLSQKFEGNVLVTGTTVRIGLRNKNLLNAHLDHVALASRMF